MPSTIIIAIEHEDEPRRDLHAVVVPDLPPDRGQGSRLRAQRLAAIAASEIAQRIGADETADNATTG